MEYMKIGTNRSGYSVSQCGSTLTVGDLIEFLSDIDRNMPIYFSNDNGYTFGSLHFDDFCSAYTEDDEDDE